MCNSEMEQQDMHTRSLHLRVFSIVFGMGKIEALPFETDMEGQVSITFILVHDFVKKNICQADFMS